jgi:hypothetical protein
VPEFPTIAELPETYRSLAESFRQGGLAIARADVPSLVQSQLVAPPMLLLREAVIRTRFYIAARADKMIFFFVRREGAERVVLDASIEFRLTPNEFTSPPLTMLPEAIAHFAVPPPFLVLEPSAADRQEFSFALGVPADRVLVLELRAGTLAVFKPESGRDARIAWRLRGANAFSRLDLDSAGEEAAEVFVSLARTVGQWVGRGFEDGREVPLDITAVATRAPVLHEIFHSICDAWARAYNETAASSGEFLPGYEVQDYRGSILLRLKPDGAVARNDDDDPFQLLLTIRIRTQDGVPRSRIAVGPPDFLAAGALRDSFLVALNGPGAFDELAAQLNTHDNDGQLRLRSFVLAAFPSALVFRVKRMTSDGGADRDTDAIIYSGAIEGREASLAVRADFIVSGGAAGRRVEYVPGTQEVLYSNLPVGSTVRPKRDLTRYGLRLLASMENWIGVLR